MGLAARLGPHASRLTVAIAGEASGLAGDLLHPGEWCDELIFAVLAGEWVRR